jgi:hypothetical protein
VTAEQSTAWESGSEVKTMTAVRIHNPPRIDGKLDDPCWKSATPTYDFIQMDPDEGKPATEQTIVRALYDDDNLYFGIECLDSEPEKIAARIVPRDVTWWPDDLIAIVLDTYYDRQNCYGFYTNPNGIQLDMRCTGDGRYQDWSWDGVWQSEGSITDQGWVAELAIPFKTLRFSRDKDQLWGVNIKRWRKTRSEDSNWAFISRDDGTELKVSKAGYLLGLEDLRQGLHLEFLPSGTARLNQDPDATEWQKDIGLDIKYGITSNLTLDATINPDFCHIEADPEKINLTRFELFYDEKRPFFMEGKELFSPMNLFYSRRIANPKLGAKLTGKLGDYSIGWLTAVDQERGPDPSYGAFRLQKDILKNSSVGIIGVGKQKTEDQYSRALGVDLRLHPGQNMLRLELAKSFNPGVKGNDWWTRVTFRRFAGKFWTNCGFYETRPEFNVDQTGYIPHDPHVGEREIGGWVDYAPVIKRFGVKRIWLGQGAWVTKRTDDHKWGWRWEDVWLDVDFENLNQMRLWHLNWYLRYQQKGYRGTTLGFRYQIRGKSLIRALGIETRIEDHYDWGDDYFGNMRTLSIWGDLKPHDNVSLDINGKVVWEYLPSGKLDEVKQVGNLRLTYLLTRDLFLRVFVPVNPASHDYAINALLSYTYRPLSSFYLAYNERRGKDMEFVDRIIMAKISYLWNL